MLEVNGTEMWNCVQQTASQAVIAIDELGKATSDYDSGKSRQLIQTIISHKDRPLKLGVLGEFKAGKSSLINALTNDEIAMTDILQATASLNLYRYGVKRSVEIQYHDGHTEEHSIEEANVILSRERDNVKWLQTISQIVFTTDCERLRRLEIWDSPGVGASDFQENLTRKFIEEVDAVLWVFDANFLGQGALAPFLKELHKRGKHILAVVNKTEDWKNDDLAAIPDILKKAYPDNSFAAIINFSALKAMEFQRGVAESEYFGDLPADGGMKLLLDTLYEKIANDPKRISAQSAAGDLRALLGSAADFALEKQMEYGRTIKLLDEQENNSVQRVNTYKNSLKDDIHKKLIGSMMDEFGDELEKKIRQTPVEQLGDQGYLQTIFESILEEDKIWKFCTKFIQQQEDRVQKDLQELLDKQKTQLEKMLTPMELSRHKNKLPLPRKLDGLKWEPDHSGSDSDKVPTVVWGTAISALVALLTGCHIIAIIGGTIALLVSLFKSSGPEEDEDTIRERCINKYKHELIGIIQKEIDPKIEESLDRLINDLGNEVLEILKKDMRSRLLGGAEKKDWQDKIDHFCELVRKLDALNNQLNDVLDMSISQPIPSLMKPCHIHAGDRDKASELFHAILADARSEICITDGKLSFSVLPKFSSADDKLAIRILTWDQPLSTTMSQKFSEKVAELQNIRNGKVTVFIPKRYGSDQAERLPEGCWLFTERHSYSINCSLDEALNASRDVQFTPHDNSERYKQFNRWWNDEVPGYQVVQAL